MMTPDTQAILERVKARLAEEKTPRQIAACREWLYEQQLAEAWQRVKEADKWSK